MEGNVLNPQLVWIDKRCYRVNIPNEKRKDKANFGGTYDSEDFEIMLDDYDECFDVESIGEGKFQLKYHVPNMFFG